MRIYIDPGHGGVDSGTRGFNQGYDESSVNLSVAFRLRDYARKVGHEVELSRASKNFRPTLTDRGRLAKIFKADVALSLHCDSAEDQRIYDQRVYYRDGDVASLDLATAIITNCPAKLRREHGEQIIRGCTKSFMPRPYNVLLHHGAYPAVLIEMGFLTNPQAAIFLNSLAGQELIAQRILIGIHQHFGITPEMVMA